jgi:hypothetical protein
MGLSALLGLLVRIALMTNLGTPEPGCVPRFKVTREVRHIQKTLSTIAMLCLACILFGYLAHAVLRLRAWDKTKAYL